jgi:hypothetical protein
MKLNKLKCSPLIISELPALLIEHERSFRHTICQRMHEDIYLKRLGNVGVKRTFNELFIDLIDANILDIDFLHEQLVAKLFVHSQHPFFHHLLVKTENHPSHDVYVNFTFQQ